MQDAQPIYMNIFEKLKAYLSFYPATLSLKEGETLTFQTSHLIYQLLHYLLKMECNNIYKDQEEEILHQKNNFIYLMYIYGWFRSEPTMGAQICKF
ncbi:MAG: hypothetical protein EZS28_011668 [Streblomastix strix]|uniref:Uncharacterized protein n=1 Tax=Streblomastix strix TaxID=222440 RepID=A0A5J4WDR0_9EUKA|nr:MAG: hypothetical protein EZS28_011668 [Streblomastix strix]